MYAPVATTTTTTYFFNYRCLHLAEMAKCRAQFAKGKQTGINQAVYETCVRMLYTLKTLPMSGTFLLCEATRCLFISMQICLSSRLWRSAALWRIRPTIILPLPFHLWGKYKKQTFGSLTTWSPPVTPVRSCPLSHFHAHTYFAGINPYDIPGHFEHLLDPCAIGALITAFQILTHAHDLGMDVPLACYKGRKLVIQTEDSLADFQFVRQRAWSVPGPRMDSYYWKKWVVGA